MSDGATLGDGYDAMTPDQRRRAFMLLFGLVQFYADGDTWVAVSILADPPAGAITRDGRWCNYLGRHAPGGRARLGLSMVLGAMKRAVANSAGGGVGAW